MMKSINLVHDAVLSFSDPKKYKMYISIIDEIHANLVYFRDEIYPTITLVKDGNHTIVIIKQSFTFGEANFEPVH